MEKIGAELGKRRSGFQGKAEMSESQLEDFAKNVAKKKKKKSKRLEDYA